MPDKVQQHIHCSVSNCHYWVSGNMCHANEIMVTSDQLSASLPDNIDAPMASQISPTPVNTCMDSCCKTFVPKGSKQIKADGVTKQ